MDQVAANQLSWSQLGKLQLGRYAEYYVKMEATRLGYDVYSPEVDYRGVDFVLRSKCGEFIEAQVKSVRRPKSSYVFMQKAKFELSDRMVLFAVIFEEGHWPSIFMIPSRVWNEARAGFVSRDYAGLASKPEYGINIRKTWRHDFSEFLFVGGA
jgi:hypothetical protein